MPRTISFWGASDDLVQVDGNAPGCNEYGTHVVNCVDAVFQVRGAGLRMNVVCVYGASGGTWCFAPALVDEGEPWPDWPLSIQCCNQGRHGVDPYSTSLVIEAPDDAEVVQLEKA